MKEITLNLCQKGSSFGIEMEANGEFIFICFHGSIFSGGIQGLILKTIHGFENYSVRKWKQLTDISYSWHMVVLQNHY